MKRYLGNDSNRTVNNMKEARYIKELIRVIDEDIALLEKLTRQYIIPEHDMINGLLPEAYRDPVLHGIRPVSPEAAEWKRRGEELRDSMTRYRPEDLTHMASDGTMMRSLSEVIIANYLISLGITFVYERPLTHHGKTIWPDFTILSPLDNKTEIIIEHQGAMDNEKYQEKYLRTIKFYLQTRLVPNLDVFFTFNDHNNNIDLRQVDGILSIAFGIGDP